jgi:AraC-like DNA-binding protein
MKQELIDESLDILGEEFPKLNWDFRPDPAGGENAVVSQWLGGADEEVMICTFKGKRIHEKFHRQDFFFLNFAYKNDYRALSARFDNEILVRENDCYIGQPYSGYALRGKSDSDIVIVGILIRRDVLENEFLTPLSSDPALRHFFLEPRIDRFSDEYIHLTLDRSSPLWQMLDIMIVEYAHRREDTQKILKPLIFSTLMMLTRAYSKVKQQEDNRPESASEEMVRYMETHLEDVSLSALSKRFGYHPNYISALLHKETGSTFSQILLAKRMERAVLLMKNTELSLERIAQMTGYANTSNFYKAFKTTYGVSPRAYQQNGFQAAKK